MNYYIDNIEIKTAKNQSEYVALTLVNADDEWDEPFVVPVWNETQIKRYKALLASPEVNGDVNKIPQEKRIFKYGFWETCKLPMPMNRIWSQDMVIKYADGTQKPVKAGEIVTDRAGHPTVYTEFMVFVKKTLDNNTNELRYANGWSFAERSAQMIARQFTTIQPTAGMPPQEAIQGAGAPQPQQQATIQQPGTVQGPQAQQAQAQPAPQPGAVPQPGAIPAGAPQAGGAPMI